MSTLVVATGFVTEATLESLVVRARGSLLDYNHSVMVQGLAQRGVYKAISRESQALRACLFGGFLMN
jgi:hypothetical protein